MEEQKKRFKYYMRALLIMLTGILLDQATKYLAVLHLKNQDAYVVWNQVFQ